MTKQEEIKEGMGKKIAEWNHIQWSKASISHKEALIKEGVFFLQYLHSQGMVLQVDDKLPDIFDLNDDMISALEYKKKLEGYVKVKSIKEKI